MRLEQRTKQKLGRKIFPIVLVSIVVVAMVFGVLSLQFDYSNNGKVKLNPNEKKYIGANLHNNVGASFINEGLIYYQGNIQNKGTMNCGACTSGANYVNNTSDDLQSISGSNRIIWYDAVLDNASGVNLSNVLEVENSFTFTDGNVFTTRSDTSSYLFFKKEAIYDNASSGGHVDGYVAKVGDDAFIFPTGDDGELHPIGISISSDPSRVFKGAYFNESAGSTTFLGGPFSLDAYNGATLEAIHEQGYWDMDANSGAQVTLYWNASSNMQMLSTDINKLAVVGWDGTQWQHLGNESVTGDVSAGSIRSKEIVPNDYIIFTVGLSADSSLQEEWLDFTAKLVNQDGLLEWHTGRELNSDYYEIQRSIDATIFETLDFVQAAGPTNTVNHYDYLDTDIVNLGIRKFYYRLKQFHVDGSFEYSKTVELNIGDGPPEIKLVVFPNPILADGSFTVRYGIPGGQMAELLVVNMLGQLILKDRLRDKGQKTIHARSWASGIYSISLSNGRITANKQLVIQ